MPENQEPWLETVVRVAEAAAAAEDGPAFRYRWDHVQAVVREAEALAHQLGGDAQIVVAAAWLHDVAKVDGHGVEQEDHAAKGAMRARTLLNRTDFPADKVPGVVEAIAKHAQLYKDGPIDPVEAAILWDADKLTKLGATGAIAALVSGLTQGGADTTRGLVQGLPPLRLYRRMADSMNTPPAQALAAARFRFLEQFYAQLVAEGWLPEEALHAQQA
jgi:uncharacterized protein